MFKGKNIIFSILILSFLTVFSVQVFAVSIVSPSHIYPDYPGYVKIQSGYLNVRSGPGTNYQSIGKLANGTAIYIHGDDGGNGWSYINYPVKGWISNSYCYIKFPHD